MCLPDRYLGDGVYASFDGYHIVLDLRAQGASRIALEPQVLDALEGFRQAIELLRTASLKGVDDVANPPAVPAGP